ncbi:MAG: anthrone oxygenase family protein [Planctomycetota bacterium]
MYAVDVVTIVAGLGSGLVAGIFFTFSNFVMPALARLPKPQGIRAMQAINLTVINPGAMLAMFGTGLVCLIMGVLGLVLTDGPEQWLYLAGALLYVLGCVGVTIAGNVPLNEKLAQADAASEEAAELWVHYLKRWTHWNTTRTIASAMASLACMAALVLS